jgi:hypothetical protein
MNRLFFYCTLISLITASSTTTALIRPTLLMLKALNDSHTKKTTENNVETDETFTTTEPDPFVTVETSTEKYENSSHTTISIDSQNISLSDIHAEDFNSAQLAFCALTATGISSMTKIISGFHGIKSPLRKAIRKNGTFALSAYVFGEYENLKNLVGWEEKYAQSTAKIDEFIRDSESVKQED